MTEIEEPRLPVPAYQLVEFNTRKFIQYDTSGRHIVRSDLASNVSYNIAALSSDNETISSVRIILQVDTRATLQDDTIELVEIETESVFSIQNLPLAEIDEGNLEIPSDFLASLMGLTYSTTRGVQLALLQSSPIKNIPLPVIDMLDLIDDRGPTVRLVSMAESSRPAATLTSGKI